MYNNIQNFLLTFTLSLFFVHNLSATEIAYPGTGDEVNNINELLVYPGIESENLTYHLGSKRTFTIRYGENFDIASFNATLNGIDISKKFHPVANTEEKIFLRLKRGENSLSLYISDLSAPGSVSEIDEDNFSIFLEGPVAHSQHLTSPPPGISKIVLPEQAAKNSNVPVFIRKTD